MGADRTSFFPVPGVRLGTTCAGIKYPQRRGDLVLMEITPHSRCAAVFTRNAFCAAPVTVAKAHLALASPRYLLINAGNANAGTGNRGLEDARASCMAVAELTQSGVQQVLPFSTGVIGEPLPLERLLAGLPRALAELRPEGWFEAACGIMTTDTRPKLVSRQLQVADQTVTVTGMAKGAGMIRPDMATMLAFIATDVHLEQPLLEGCLRAAVADSFNAITVDGDTSTNDACVLVATGRSGVRIETPGEIYDALQAAIRRVCIELAQAIVRDGEGATKFVTLQVEQGRDVAECRQLAFTVAHSPLVKTALFASDPNWGRILAAVGRAGLEDLKMDDIAIYLGDVCVVRAGARATEYTEDQGRRALAGDEISVRITLGRGEAAARILTTDLSYDYVRINAEYRT